MSGDPRCVVCITFKSLWPIEPNPICNVRGAINGFQWIGCAVAAIGEGRGERPSGSAGRACTQILIAVKQCHY